MSDTSTRAIVKLIQEQILNDIRNELVPASISSFGELHDYVDANTYGDPLILERERTGEDWITFVEGIQCAVNAWLDTGRPSSFNTERYLLGRISARGTQVGSFIHHGKPIEHKGYDRTSPTTFSDTFWYLRGWNDVVDQSNPDGTRRIVRKWEQDNGPE